MGLAAIDESLDRLLATMSLMPDWNGLGYMMGLAKAVGIAIALGVGSYECWMMMLGRRGMDVMKILRIIIISICISQSTTIAYCLKYPGMHIEQTAKASLESKNREVAALELKVAQKQASYIERLRAAQDSLSKAAKVEQLGEDPDWWDKIIYSVSNLNVVISDFVKRAAVVTETKVSEWINDIIRFVAELLFQMSYYGMLVAQRIFLALMTTVAPLMFALSLAPPWQSAWSQWMSKFLSLSLWGWVTYTCIYYVDFILIYNLTTDLEAYDVLLNGNFDDVNSWEQIGALGLQGIGSNCMYAMGMLVGMYILRFVPEAASWLIPGGVSSGVGERSGSVGVGIVKMGGSAAGSAAGFAGNQAAKSLTQRGIHDPNFGKSLNNK